MTKMEKCKCDYCDSNRAESRSFNFGDFGTHYFFACTDCWNDYLREELD